MQTVSCVTLITTELFSATLIFSFLILSWMEFVTIIFPVTMMLSWDYSPGCRICPISTSQTSSWREVATVVSQDRVSNRAALKNWESGTQVNPTEYLICRNFFYWVDVSPCTQEYITYANMPSIKAKGNTPQQPAASGKPFCPMCRLREIARTKAGEEEKHYLTPVLFKIVYRASTRNVLYQLTCQQFIQHL